MAGLGDLRIGGPVPSGSSWAERGAQINESCRTVSSPDHPGVYAIVEKGTVRRITLGARSTIAAAPEIRVGASESAARRAVPGLTEEGHAYVEAPGKYLTGPEAGGAAWRFEIGRDGNVALIHAGIMPVLGYVEGCA